MNNDKIWDLIVIGGGPAGMMAGGRAAELGASVLVLEKNPELGRKLSVTGGGRCNITNAIFDTRDFLENFPEAKNFLYSPFSKFSVQDTFDFFENLNLPLDIQARRRTFPKSGRASDVTKTLVKYLKKTGATFKTNTEVWKLSAEGEKINSVNTSQGKFYAHNFILSTGGLAAKKNSSGSADGLMMASKIGHTIKKPNPNIVPLKVREKWVKDLFGTTLSFITIRFYKHGEKKATIKKTGKILFTHFGVSGPLILNSSYEVKKLLANGPVEVSLDLFPDTDLGALDRKLWRLFEQNKNKDLKNTLSELITKKLALVIIQKVEKKIDSSLLKKPVHSITKDERKEIVNILKDLRFTIIDTMGFEWAVIADGGVVPEEINFKNMSSKLFPNLYIIGDSININRPSGGFSLQLCWTTGWVAGTDIGQKTTSSSKSKSQR